MPSDAGRAASAALGFAASAAGRVRGLGTGLRPMPHVALESRHGR